MKYVYYLTIFLLLVSCSGLKKIENETYHYGEQSLQNISDENWTKAIRKAGIKRGWQCRKETLGVMRCDLQVRRHEVSVDVKHDSKDLTIVYVTSKNLNAKDGKIHASYFKWVKTFKKEIIKEIHKILYQ